MQPLMSASVCLLLVSVAGACSGKKHDESTALPGSPEQGKKGKGTEDTAETIVPDRELAKVPADYGDAPKDRAEWGAMITAKVPRMLGPLHGLSFWMSYGQARKVHPGVSNERDKEWRLFSIRLSLLDGDYDRPQLDFDETPSIEELNFLEHEDEKVYSYSMVVPDDSLSTLQAAWGRPIEGKSASGTFHTWINKDEGLSATLWKDPHDPAAIHPVLIVKPWAPVMTSIQKFVGKNSPLGHTMDKLRERLAPAVSQPERRRGIVIVPAMGAHSQLSIARLSITEEKVTEVEVSVPFDEDPEVLPLAVAALETLVGKAKTETDELTGKEIMRFDEYTTLKIYRRQKQATLRVGEPE